MPDKWLPTESVGVILLPAAAVRVLMLPCRDTRQGNIITRTVSAGRISVRKYNHANNHGRKPFFADSSLGRKNAGSLSGSQICRTVSAGSEKWWTSLYPVVTDSHHIGTGIFQ